MNKNLWQRYMTFSEILNESFRLLKINLLPILLIVFCTHTPINLLRTLFSKVLPVEKYGEATVSLALSGVKWIDSLFSLVVFISIAYIVERSLQGQETSFVDIVKFSFSRFGDVFWISILLSVITLGGALLLIVPGIIWSNYFSFAIAISALRGLKGMVALKTSKKLVTGQWWRIFGIHIAITIYALIINLPVFILSKKVPDMKLLYIFTPLTIFNVVAAIVTVMAIVLFLNTEYVRDFQNQTRG